MNEFNVLVWDINRNELITYDVMPYFRNAYKATKKKERPVTKEQWIEFVKQKSMYLYRARCEYEILVSQWPPRKNPEMDKHVKIDVWQQIEMNLGLLVNLLMSELCK